MIPRWKERFIKLWMRIRVGFSGRKEPLIITVHAHPVSIIRTEVASQEPCSWCGRSANRRTQVNSALIPYDIDVWHCSKHAPDWREYLPVS